MRLFCKTLLVAALITPALVYAGSGQATLPELLTIHNSTESDYRPCVVASEHSDGLTSIGKILQKTDSVLNGAHQPYCSVSSSPDVRLVLFKPEHLTDGTKTRDAGDKSITASVENATSVRVPQDRNLIIAGYKTLYWNDCLGKDCDKHAWGGCWLGLFPGDDDMDDPPTECHNGDGSSFMDFGGGTDYTYPYHLEDGFFLSTSPSNEDTSWGNDDGDQNPYWVQFHWRRSEYLLANNTDSEKMPIFNTGYWDKMKLPVISDQHTEGYHAEISLDKDGSTLEFYVEPGGLLALRYLDIHIRSKSKIVFCGPGTVEFTGVRIIGDVSGLESLIEICDDPSMFPDFKFGNDDTYNGLTLIPHDGHGLETTLQSYIKLPHVSETFNFYANLLDSPEGASNKMVFDFAGNDIIRGSAPPPFSNFETDSSPVTCRLNKTLLQAWRDSGAFCTLDHAYLETGFGNVPLPLLVRAFEPKDSSNEVGPVKRYSQHTIITSGGKFPVRLDSVYYTGSGDRIVFQEPTITLVRINPAPETMIIDMPTCDATTQEWDATSASCHCKSGFEDDGGTCRATCAGGQVRDDVSHDCKCPGETVLQENQCVTPTPPPPPTCPDGQTLVGGECVVVGGDCVGDACGAAPPPSDSGDTHQDPQPDDNKTKHEPDPGAGQKDFFASGSGCSLNSSLKGNASGAAFLGLLSIIFYTRRRQCRRTHH